MLANLLSFAVVLIRCRIELSLAFAMSDIAFHAAGWDDDFVVQLFAEEVWDTGSFSEFPC